MLRKNYNSTLYLICCATIAFTLLFFSVQQIKAQQKKFTVVLDAGHGGHDPGAIGRISREKDITLSVVKKVGGLIDKYNPDVKVVYTRSSDVFIPLEDRAQTANNYKADLFISIHVNASKATSAYGSETYTMGLAKSKSNLDVAMTENAVMLLEDNYQTKYKGFDPNSVESYIMFDIMMDQYLDKSISFAQQIQNQFAFSAKRYDRGVRQAGFWVLHRSACPSVLIELGFISNYAEELYLTGENGQSEMAASVFNAFTSFKRDFDKKQGYNRSGSVRNDEENAVTVNSKETVIPKEVVSVKTDTVQSQSVKSTEKTVNETINNALQDKPLYKIQICASEVPLKEHEFKGIKNYSSYREKGYIKYTVGSDTNYNNIIKLRKELLEKFPDAFIIAFVNGKKIPVNDALKIK